MTQHEIKERHPLLDENGHLIETGYAKSLILDYDRDSIKANSLRIKEWDYYLIYNDDFGVAYNPENPADMNEMWLGTPYEIKGTFKLLQK